MASPLDNNNNEVLYYKLLHKAANKVAQDKLMRSNWIKIMIERIEEAKHVIANDSYDNLHPKVKETLKKYIVREVVNPKKPNNKEKKLFMKKEGTSVSWVVVPLTETFPIAEKAHLLTNHGGVTEMAEWLSNSKFVISSICLPIILDVCECQKKETEFSNVKNSKNNEQKSSTSPNITNANAGLIDIVNMSMYDTKDELDHLLIYIDIRTKFLQLRPVSSANLVETTCKELMQLFSDIGPPEYILVSVAFKNLFIQVLNWLNQIFSPPVKILQKEQVVRQMKSYSVKKVETAINNWLEKNEGHKWSIGCFIVQWELNNKCDEDGTIPFEKVRGLKNRIKSTDDQISESVRGLNINHSNDKIDDFISHNPVLEMPNDF